MSAASAFCDEFARAGAGAAEAAEQERSYPDRRTDCEALFGVAEIHFHGPPVSRMRFLCRTIGRTRPDVYTEAPHLQALAEKLNMDAGSF